MAKKLYEEENIRAIADAIRGKCGTAATFKCCDMAAAIANLSVADTTMEDNLVEGKVVEYTNDRVGMIRPFGFAGVSQLISIDLPNVDYSLPMYCFYLCSKLTTINLPQATPMVDMYCFAQCTSLTNINLPAITTIGMNAFDGCSALTTADFSATSGVLSSISTYAFYNCSNLTTLIIRSETMPTLYNASTFGFTPIEEGTGYIYVPRALVDTYKADTNWSIYANQFRALEDYTVDGTRTGALDTTKI